MEEMTGRRALLVDDERDMLTLLAKVLTKKCGCAVTTATSAEVPATPTRPFSTSVVAWPSLSAATRNSVPRTAETDRGVRMRKRESGLALGVAEVELRPWSRSKTRRPA